MVDFSQPVSFAFIVGSILAIFAVVGVGIVLVKKFKR